MNESFSKLSLIFRLIMENFLKIKKRKITVLILLIYNQFLFNSYAQNYKGIYSSNTINQYLQKNNKKYLINSLPKKIMMIVKIS